jgi:uroporphyrinogen-III synthase
MASRVAMTEQTAVLAGLSIAITRPLHQGDSLVSRLRAQGADATTIPLLTIAPLVEAAQVEAAKAQLQALDRVDIAIFVSRNAAEQLLQALAAQAVDWPNTITSIAVGSPTAQFLNDNGIVAISPARMDSEGMLALPALQTAQGKHCVIFRGIGGRETTAQTLRARGATVGYCELYQRVLPASAQDLWQSWINSGHTHKWACINSVETLHNLLQIDPQAATRANLTLVVPGERVTEYARRAGFSRIHTAVDATDHQMFQTIIHGCHS